MEDFTLEAISEGSIPPTNEDLARREFVVDKVFERMGVTYTQLTRLEHSWLVIVPNSVLSPPYSEEKPFGEPHLPPTTPNQTNEIPIKR